MSCSLSGSKRSYVSLDEENLLHVFIICPFLEDGDENILDNDTDEYDIDPSVPNILSSACIRK